MLLAIIKKLPLGFSKGIYHARCYGITKAEYNDGKSIKIFAKELGGNDFISLNYYITNNNTHLKPCEMPEEKVLDFLTNVKLI